MSKAQKIWLWIFIAMFAIPELLFFTTINLVMSFLGRSFLNLSSLVVNYEVFFQHPYYLLSILAVEWIGMAGLIAFSFKKQKIIIALLSLIILLWLSFAFCVVYVTGVSMNF
jgi:hypothetical protein